jgi:hypothetical protein
LADIVIGYLGALGAAMTPPRSFLPIAPLRETQRPVAGLMILSGEQEAVAPPFCETDLRAWGRAWDAAFDR